FTTKTKGLLYSRTVPITSSLTGWGAPLKMWQNLAKTSNRGFEATINSRNIRTKDFTWNSTLSLTWSKEKIDELPDGDIIAENLFEGQPIKSHYGYKYIGLWQTTDDADLMKTHGVKPGFIKIETLDNDGDGGLHKYGEKDRQVLGHQNPDWIIGLNNTFTYKGFDLSIFAMARVGQTISSSLIGWYDAKQSVTTNQLSGVDYWTESNQGAYYPRPGTGGDQSTVYSSLRYRDGSFIKLKNITLGYTLPKSISRKALMEKLRFYVTAYNPVIWTMDSQLKDTDPEMNGADAFPTYRQFVFGVNVTF
ncbi:MAG: SusC/RagA family protein, partial [Prevotella sp.]|nr:SusC/RagA family protein [Prevotella sp.]